METVNIRVPKVLAMDLLGAINNSLSADQINGKAEIPDGALRAPAKPTGFKFGATSEKELIGVKPELVSVARKALTLSTQDFMIFDGLRTKKEQAANVAKGVSQTMNSKHLAQGDGFSHAFDAVPVVNGKPVWDWKLIYPVAFAIDQAATELGYANRIRWGGAWDRTLGDFGGSADAYRIACANYCERHPGKDFIDGPHFEWIS